MNAKKKGFTLVELILVMTIIALLMALLLPQIPALMRAYKVQMSQWRMATLITGIEQYKNVYHDYPHDLVRMSKDNKKLLNSITNRGSWGGDDVADYGSTQGSHSLFLALQGPDGTGWRPDATNKRLLEFPPFPESPKWVSVPGSGNPNFVMASYRHFVDPFGRPILYYKAHLDSKYADINFLRGEEEARYHYIVNWLTWEDGDFQRGANESTDWRLPWVFGDRQCARRHWTVALTRSMDAAKNRFPYNDKSYVLWMAGEDEKFGHWIWREENKGYIPDPDPTSAADGVLGVCDDIRNY